MFAFLLSMKHFILFFDNPLSELFTLPNSQLPSGGANSWGGSLTKFLSGPFICAMTAKNMFVYININEPLPVEGPFLSRGLTGPISPPLQLHDPSY